MGYRNLGPNVSESPHAVAPGGGQYTAEDHSFESIVFEQGKPPLDWEMNLLQEALGSYGLRRNTQRILPSNWVVGSYLENPVPQGLIFFTADPGPATTANQFQITASDVIVNGWDIRFDLSWLGANASLPSWGSVGLNTIVLPSPPSSGVRTDFVILEVWRALVSPSPDSTNKSPTGQILRYGNAKAPDTTANQNLLDDLIDPVFLQESSRRVQIQYRYRVVSIASLTATPDGFDDAAVFANTTPYLGGSTIDGNATSYTYQKATNDPGLWVAGTGDSTAATAFGSADGYMYAVPICAVFRRNHTAFNRATNLNGGALMSSGTSDRPDGLFSDQIVAGDVKDLRKSIAFDLKEVMDKAYNQVLDNSMSTEHEYSSDGPAGWNFLSRDNIGTSGHIGNPDGVRNHFSDRSVTESVVCKVTLAGASAFNLALGTLPLYTGGSTNVEGLAPIGTNILGFGRIRADRASDSFDLTDITQPVFITNVALSAAPGPAIDFAVFTLSGVLTGDVFIEVLIEYPNASGIHRNITQPVQLWTPPIGSLPGWVDATTLDSHGNAYLRATSDSNRKALSEDLWWTDNPHRELIAQFRSVSQTFSSIWDGITPAFFYVPDNIHGAVSLTYNSGGSPVTYTTSDYEFNHSFTAITLNVADPPDGGTTITATYVASRPFPITVSAPGDSYQIFYQTQAVQSIAVPSGTQLLRLTPRSFGGSLSVITSGSGSPDDSFPFASPSCQLPIGSQPSASFPEARLDTPSPISVIGFGATSGYIQLPVFVPYTPDPSQVTLYKNAPDVTIDGDNRNFWPKSDNGSSPVYAPTLFAQSLSFLQKHKVAYPALMELKQDFASIGRAGTLVLVVFTKWSEFDDQDGIQLSSSASDSCAAVYRVRGNMINPRRAS